MAIMSVSRGRKRSSCSGPRDFGFFTRSEIAVFWPETYQILQFHDIRKRRVGNKINALRLVQAGLFRGAYRLAA
jgi:hypothetical protein